MKKYWVGGVFGILITLAGAASFAAETGKVEVETAAPARPWKLTSNSYFYDFQGTAPANDNLYSFGKLNLFLQLLTLEHQISDDWTMMVVGSFLSNYAETNMFGMTFQDTTRGLGDTTVLGMRQLTMTGSLLVLGDVGISVPTGSISQINKNNPAVHYAYNMQMGSGTADGTLGMTALWLKADYNLGGRFSTLLRTGRNSNGYRLGNQYKLDAWAEVPLGHGFSPRLVGYYKFKDPIQGQDYTLDRTILTEYYYHPQLNWDLSAALRYQRALIGSASLTAEIGLPVLQGMRNADNVAVSTNYYGTVAVSGNF